MAKDQSFAAKVAKATAGKSGTTCAECGEVYSAVKLITSEKSATTDAWKFNQRLVQVCKCNQSEVYG